METKQVEDNDEKDNITDTQRLDWLENIPESFETYVLERWYSKYPDLTLREFIDKQLNKKNND